MFHVGYYSSSPSCLLIDFWKMASGVNVSDQPVSFTHGPRERQLEIGIIGAGIAGLGAAIALGQAGHDVEVRQLAELCASESVDWRR